MRFSIFDVKLAFGLPCSNYEKVLSADYAVPPVIALFFNVFFQQFAYSRDNIQILMGYRGKLGGQDPYFFMNRLVFVHDKQILAFNGTQAALNFNPRSLQILFGNCDLHAFRQIFKLLIELIGFHLFQALQALKIAACVLL